MTVFLKSVMKIRALREKRKQSHVFVFVAVAVFTKTLSKRVDALGINKCLKKRCSRQNQRSAQVLTHNVPVSFPRKL